MDHVERYADAERFLRNTLQTVSEGNKAPADDFLRDRGIVFSTSSDGDRLPPLPSHDELRKIVSSAEGKETQLLSPPASISPAPHRHPEQSRTAHEWARLFLNTLTCIFRRSHDRIPRLAVPESIDAWHQFLLRGQKSAIDPHHTIWLLESLVEAGGFCRCVMADAHRRPPKRSSLLLSELVCLLVLACRQLHSLSDPQRDPEDLPLVISLTTFTPTSARLLQAYLEPSGSDHPATIHIIKQSEIQISDVVGQDQEGPWLDVVSWLCAGPPQPSAGDLYVPKSRGVASGFDKSRHGRRNADSNSTSEGISGVFSTPGGGREERNTGTISPPSSSSSPQRGAA